MGNYPLVLKQINKSFNDGDKNIKILSDLSFAVEKGELAAVIGPSGSGKSTFLSIAGALLTPDNGEIYINGKDVSSLSDVEKADVRLQSIGYIFQTSNLVPYLKVEEQLGLVLKMAKHNRGEKSDYVRNLLESVGMEHRSSHYPHQLSGGEKQRVAIARAFANDPDIILADEPTASLDSNRSAAIIRLISRIVKEKNKAGIIVTHDEGVLPFCDRIYAMQDGQLLEQTTKRGTNNASVQ
ncbi:ABC transporter ATP-binding protein [Bacillus sp. ISL-47]|uniref:ABC transporter ATP-binding protein n=1 Tax=Bacillus sp. ISL-47 TaxID=2819130 RepID=UPI001BE8788F|nr:ABC transporter ATP-binding protein [Bacillus sp. ISL-47]MBT2687623.1 ABC transporter ATP-binding protein [Bacillus sp. ISL-47]MBT2711138.1 ABC transporter ATP-binding protein [Pseudomonas sp. ISL-84]